MTMSTMADEGGRAGEFILVSTARDAATRAARRTTRARAVHLVGGRRLLPSRDRGVTRVWISTRPAKLVDPERAVLAYVKTLGGERVYLDRLTPGNGLGLGMP